jgi:hypothetical protein
MKLQDHPIELQEKFKRDLLEETKRIINAYLKENILVEYDPELIPIIKTKSTSIEVVNDSYSDTDVLDPEDFNHMTISSGSTQKNLIFVISLDNGDVCRISITIDVYHNDDSSDFSFESFIYYMSLTAQDGFQHTGRARGETLSDTMKIYYPKFKKAHLKSLIK